MARIRQILFAITVKKFKIKDVQNSKRFFWWMEDVSVIKHSLSRLLGDSFYRLLNKWNNNSLFLVLRAWYELNAFSLVKIGFDPTSWRMLKENECQQLSTSIFEGFEEELTSLTWKAHKHKLYRHAINSICFGMFRGC